MRLLFCDSGFSHKEVDYCYTDEYQAAQKGPQYRALISLEALRCGDINLALRYVKATTEPTPAIYRGWMLTPKEYQQLYQGLLAKNIQLINSPEQYQFCHYLPENYSIIKEVTPLTTFKKLEGKFSYEQFEEALKVFGDQPIIVKDYVKSQKHYWEEACYMPKASDRQQVEAVVKRFIELQGEDLNVGLVFRAFVELEQLTTHSQSGMPLTKEFRLFVYKGKVLQHFQYWDEGDYQHSQANWEAFESLIPQINSNFFTMDIAQTTKGEWIIVELGDGQVAGLPDNANKIDFIQQLQA